MSVGEGLAGGPLFAAELVVFLALDLADAQVVAVDGGGKHALRMFLADDVVVQVVLECAGSDAADAGAGGAGERPSGGLVRLIEAGEALAGEVGAFVLGLAGAAGVEGTAAAHGKHSARSPRVRLRVRGDDEEGGRGHGRGRCGSSTVPGSHSYKG